MLKKLLLLGVLSSAQAEEVYGLAKDRFFDVYQGELAQVFLSSIFDLSLSVSSHSNVAHYFGANPSKGYFAQSIQEGKLNYDNTILPGSKELAQKLASVFDEEFVARAKIEQANDLEEPTPVLFIALQDKADIKLLLKTLTNNDQLIGTNWIINHKVSDVSDLFQGSPASWRLNAFNFLFSFDAYEDTEYVYRDQSYISKYKFDSKKFSSLDDALSSRMVQLRIKRKASRALYSIKKIELKKDLAQELYDDFADKIVSDYKIEVNQLGQLLARLRELNNNYFATNLSILQNGKYFTLRLIYNDDSSVSLGLDPDANEEGEALLSQLEGNKQIAVSMYNNSKKPDVYYIEFLYTDDVNKTFYNMLTDNQIFSLPFDKLESEISRVNWIVHINDQSFEKFKNENPNMKFISFTPDKALAEKYKSKGLYYIQYIENKVA